MALTDAYAQYNNNKILAASPPELTLMLYEGAIKYCNIAIVALEQRNIQKCHKNIVKVQDIITYLRETLDMKYPVAQDFENIYVFLLSRLFDANVKKDKKILEEINIHLHSIRDTWKEVMRINRQKGTL